jgi:hypothetical protein
LKRSLITWTIVVLILAIAGVASLTLYVEFRVIKTVRAAQAEHPGDPVAALIAGVESESGCTRQKARYLWALGQLGNDRALPALRRQTGSDPEESVCDHEARFAIVKLEENRSNLPAFVWRRLWEN